jgi:hypothetical protein
MSMGKQYLLTVGGLLTEKQQTKQSFYRLFFRLAGKILKEQRGRPQSGLISGGVAVEQQDEINERRGRKWVILQQKQKMMQQQTIITASVSGQPVWASRC